MFAGMSPAEAYDHLKSSTDVGHTMKLAMDDIKRDRSEDSPIEEHGKTKTCDGCQLSCVIGEEWKEGNASEPFHKCKDCGYQICQDCSVHACTKMSHDESIERNDCNGFGKCECSSCRNELRRILSPGQCVEWCGTLLPPSPRTMEDLLVDNQIYHHNLARGCCYCPDSNFGDKYYNVGYMICYMGAKGGRPYHRPDFCWFCCREHPVGAPKLLQCSRCHEARYCNVQCQKAHWKSHKHACSSSV